MRIRPGDTPIEPLLKALPNNTIATGGRSVEAPIFRTKGFEPDSSE
jgi:hypothetical protein